MRQNVNPFWLTGSGSSSSGGAPGGSGGGSGGGETFVLKSDRVHAKVGGGRLHDEIWAKHVIDYFRHVAKASKCDSDNSKSTMFFSLAPDMLGVLSTLAFLVNPEPEYTAPASEFAFFDDPFPKADPLDPEMLEQCESGMFFTLEDLSPARAQMLDFAPRINDEGSIVISKLRAHSVDSERKAAALYLDDGSGPADSDICVLSPAFFFVSSIRECLPVGIREDIDGEL